MSGGNGVLYGYRHPPPARIISTDSISRPGDHHCRRTAPSSCVGRGSSGYFRHSNDKTISPVIRRTPQGKNPVGIQAARPSLINPFVDSARRRLGFRRGRIETKTLTLKLQVRCFNDEMFAFSFECHFILRFSIRTRSRGGRDFPRFAGMPACIRLQDTAVIGWGNTRFHVFFTYMSYMMHALEKCG